MKRVLLIGPTASGKTTLCQYLHRLRHRYQKTQTIAFYDRAIDTPGEYLERRGAYSALMVTAAECDLIALVCDPLREQNVLPPNFAGAFAKPVLGIVTKSEQATPAQLARAQEILTDAGAGPIFIIDTLAGKGLAALEAALA